MDTRETIKETETFLPLIRDLENRHAKVNVLFDNKGLTRYEGRILDIRNKKQEIYLLLEDGLEIALTSLIAVNGIIVPSYSEC